jgi:hypothetical protein
MFHLQSIVRLGWAALRWLRQPSVRPSRSRPSHSRPSLESLPDRILPRVDLADGMYHNLSQELSDLEPEQMRFMEIPKSGALPTYWECDAFSLSPQQKSDILGGPSRVKQLGTPAIALGTVEFGRETIPTLDLRFGSLVMAYLVFGEEGAGSASEPGSAANTRPSLLGGLVEVYSGEGERRFLMDNRGADRDSHDGRWLTTPLNALHYLGDVNSKPAALGDRPVLGSRQPTESAPLAETGGPSLAPFIAGWPGGTQIAGGLAAQGSDDAPVNGMAEVAANAPGNPADVLLAVDTVLPEAGADLVRLHNADLAVVPTFVVGEAPAARVAPSRADDRPDLGLTAQVVGLDELPGGVGRAQSPTDPLFEQMALVDQMAMVDGGRGVEALRLAAAGVQSGGTEAGDAPPAAARADPAAAATDAGRALREWLLSLLQQGGAGAALVSVLAFEGLLAYLCSRGWRPGSQVARPQ